MLFKLFLLLSLSAFVFAQDLSDLPVFDPQDDSASGGETSIQEVVDKVADVVGGVQPLLGLVGQGLSVGAQLGGVPQLDIAATAVNLAGQGLGTVLENRHKIGGALEAGADLVKGAVKGVKSAYEGAKKLFKKKAPAAPPAKDAAAGAPAKSMSGDDVADDVEDDVPVDSVEKLKKGVQAVQAILEARAVSPNDVANAEEDRAFARLNFAVDQALAHLDMFEAVVAEAREDAAEALAQQDDALAVVDTQVAQADADGGDVDVDAEAQAALAVVDTQIAQADGGDGEDDEEAPTGADDEDEDDESEAQADAAMAVNDASTNTASASTTVPDYAVALIVIGAVILVALVVVFIQLALFLKKGGL